MRIRLAAGLPLLALAAVLVLAQGGGESRHEALIKQTLGELEKITKTLTGIKDQATAKAAQPELKEADKRLLALVKEAGEIKQPSKAEKERLAKAYEARMQEAVKKLRDEERRVKTVPGGDEALKELTSLREKKK
jgi:cytochrome c556